MKRLMAILTAVGLMAAIANAQTLQVSVDKLTQSGSIRGGATAQAFTVLNSGTATSYYTVADNAAWMSCSPTSGSSTNEGDTITVTYVTTNLSVGKYDGTITITQTNAPVTTKTIAVTLTIDREISKGVVVGPTAFALEPDSVAIGDRGTALAASRASGAVQIGPGVNTTDNSLQFRGVPLVVPGYGVCVVTNLDANGTTNICTFVGTVSYP